MLLRVSVVSQRGSFVTHSLVQTTPSPSSLGRRTLAMQELRRGKGGGRILPPSQGELEGV